MLIEEKMLGSLLDMILPDVCPFCEAGEQDGLLCNACAEELDGLRINGPICVVCGAPFASKTAESHTCGQCLKNETPFIEARSVFEYSGNIRDAIHRFKYGGQFILAKPFGQMLADAVKMFSIKPDFVVPVPLHKRRLQARGFNQSLLLSRGVAKRLSIGLDYTNLRRSRETAPQIELKTGERKENVAGAFELKDPSMFKDKSALLVDDVFTTGATAHECARVLKKAGANVGVLTLARAVQQ